MLTVPNSEEEILNIFLHLTVVDRQRHLAQRLPPRGILHV